MLRIHGRALAVGFHASGIQRATVDMERIAAITRQIPGSDGYIRRVARETTQGPTEASEGARAAINAGHEDLVRATAVCSAAPLRTVAFGVGLAVGYFVDPAFVSALDASSDSLELRTPPSVWVAPPPVELFSA